MSAIVPHEVGAASRADDPASASARRTYFCFAISSSTSLASSAGSSFFRRCSIRSAGSPSFPSAPTMYFHCCSRAFALGQVQLGHQLAEPLQRDRLAVLVVVLDDLLLVLRVFLVHGGFRRGPGADPED